MSEPQRRTAPLPRAQAFVVCREILEDCRSHDFVLIAPFSAVKAVAFPVTARLLLIAVRK